MASFYPNWWLMNFSLRFKTLLFFIESKSPIKSLLRIIFICPYCAFKNPLIYPNICWFGGPIMAHIFSFDTTYSFLSRWGHQYVWLSIKKVHLMFCKISPLKSIKIFVSHGKYNLGNLNLSNGLFSELKPKKGMGRVKVRKKRNINYKELRTKI